MNNDLKVFCVDNQALAIISDIPSNIASNVLKSVFDEIAAAGVSVDMICFIPIVSVVTEIGFSFADADLPLVLSALSKAVSACTTSENADKPRITVSGGHVKLVVATTEMAQQVGYAERFFDALNSCGATPYLVSSGYSEISALVPRDFKDDLYSAMCKVFGGNA